MKRKIFIILCLILSLVLSCEKDALDRVLIQGGMDASLPEVVVAEDPDKVSVTVEPVVTETVNREYPGYDYGEYETLLSDNLSRYNGEIIDYLERSKIENADLVEKSVKDAVDSSLDKKFSQLGEVVSGYIDSSVSSSLEKNIALLASSETENDEKEEETPSEKVSSSIVSAGESFTSMIHDGVTSLIKENIKDSGESNDRSDVREEDNNVEREVLRFGIYYTLGDEGYVLRGYEEGLDALIIPETIDGILVVAIEDGAFKYCSSLKGDVVLPKSIKRIGNEAFMGSGIDGNLYIPSSLIYIGDKAFYGTKIKGDLIIPSSVTYIGNKAFSGCKELGDSVFGGIGLLYVGDRVFESSGIKNSFLPPEISYKLGF